MQCGNRCPLASQLTMPAVTPRGRRGSQPENEIRSSTFRAGSALEQELGLLGLDEQAQLLAEDLVAGQRRVGVDDGERHLPGTGDPLLVAAEAGQFQVALALLAGAEGGSLAPGLPGGLGPPRPARA